MISATAADGTQVKTKSVDSYMHDKYFLNEKSNAFKTTNIWLDLDLFQELHDYPTLCDCQMPHGLAEIWLALESIVVSLVTILPWLAKWLYLLLLKTGFPHLQSRH